MHRLVNFKLKKKQDSNRSTIKDSTLNQSDENSPILELTLSDSTSFRASVILPDLSRRFTLLRSNGELLPIDNFCEHVRHELATGQITQEDESILIHQYRQQYLSETPPFSPCSPTSPTESNSTLLFSTSPKTTSKPNHLLFPGNSTARDVAYIHKAIRMSNKKMQSDASQLNYHSSVDAPVEQFDPSEALDVISELPIPIDAQAVAQPRHVAQTNLTQGANEDLEDKISIELTQVQLQRLSLAVDRILESHQTSKTPNANLRPFSPQDLLDRLTSPSPSFSNQLDAESRVHEELTKALPVESSLPAHSSLNVDNPRFNTACSLNQSLHQVDNFSPHPTSLHQFTLVPTLSHASLSDFYDEDLDLIPENEFDDDSSDLNESPRSVPTFSRDQLLSLSDWTHDDTFFFQKTFSSSQSPQLREKPVEPLDLTYDDVLFIQSALCPPQSNPLQQLAHVKTEGRSDGNTSVSPCPSNPIGSPESAARVISPRSSSLQHRLNLAKNSATDSGRTISPLYHPCHQLHSPVESTFDAPPSLSHQTLSPLADSPDAFSFPLTPPLTTRTSLVGHAYIPSPPIDSDPCSNETYNEARPRGFNSRAGRSVPTTRLFRDVEAQVVAANVALRQASSINSNAPTHGKKLHPRKKSISAAQVGAPTLLSASARLSELELDKSAQEKNTSNTPASKDILKKTSFKLRLRKKRPSESRSSHYNEDIVTDATPKRAGLSNLIQADESTPTNAPSSTPFLQARDSIVISPIQTRQRLTDPVESHGSRKNPNALTSRVRKLIGRQRKLTYNSVSVAKHHPDPSRSIDSNDTSNELSLINQVSNLEDSSDPQKIGFETDAVNAWTPSPTQSSQRSKPFNELGLSSSDTPSRDSDMDDRHDRNSLIVSVIPPDLSYRAPFKGEPHSMWTEVSSFPRSGSMKSYDIRQGPRQGSQQHSVHSDYASSILDLYGCDTQSTTASSPKRFSNTSCYSNPYDVSRPISGLNNANREQPSLNYPDVQLNDLDRKIDKTSGQPNLIQTSNVSSSRQNNNKQNELMVMVQQLQNSTRHSEYETARASFNTNGDSSAASFVKNIVNGNTDGKIFKMNNGNLPHEYVDDDDEAEVWKQILRG